MARRARPISQYMHVHIHMRVVSSPGPPVSKHSLYYTFMSMVVRQSCSYTLQCAAGTAHAAHSYFRLANVPPRRLFSGNIHDFIPPGPGLLATDRTDLLRFPWFGCSSTI